MASILLIDDDEILCSLMADVLRFSGHKVASAREGRTGLELYQAGHHDLIITDMVMPGMEGLDLIGSLRQAVPRPRIIAISGASKYSTGLYLPAAQLLGAQCTLAKPIRSDALLRAVADVLARPAPPPEPRPDTAALAGGAERARWGT